MWPDSSQRIKVRYSSFKAAGLLPVTARALNAAVVLGCAIPTLAMVASSGVIVALLGARAAGLAIALTAIVVFAVGLGALIAELTGCTNAGMVTDISAR
jgi:hypothetical protein